MRKEERREKRKEKKKEEREMGFETKKINIF